MRLWLSRIWAAIQLYLLADIPRALEAERVIRGRYNELKGDLDRDLFPGISAESSVVDRLWEEETIRRKTVEEKARGNLLALTVSSSLIFAGFSFLTNQQATQIVTNHRFLPIAFIVPVAFFLAAVVSAVKALEVGEVHSTGIEDEALPPNALIVRRLNYLELNGTNTNIKANWTTASFSSLRNAVVCLFLFTTLIASFLFFNGSHLTQRPSIASVTNAPSQLQSAPADHSVVSGNTACGPCCPCNCSKAAPGRPGTKGTQAPPPKHASQE
jgi:hypothetical protein